VRTETHNGAFRYAGRPIVLTTSSLDDTRIQDAVASCIDPDDGGGIQSIVSPSPAGEHTGRSGRLNWREITNENQ